MSASGASFSEYVKRARKGDADAFAALYAGIYKDLYRIALCNLRSSHDAADAVSDAVLDAFTSIGKLKDEKAFKSWMIKILTAKIKTKQKEYMNNTTQDISDVEQEITDNGFDGLEITEAFGELDENERLVMSLGIVGGYSSDEIAKLCNMKAATVRSKLSRARIKLRNRLSSE